MAKSQVHSGYLAGSNLVEEGKQRVGIVLTGAAARGAFQAGVLSELLPVLHERGLIPRVYLGTSAGAINATLMASYAHLSVPTATENLLEVWARMGQADVLVSPMASISRDLAKFWWGVAGRGNGIQALLDTKPLHRTAKKVLHVNQANGNVGQYLDALGVVATRVPPTKGRVFKELGKGLTGYDPSTVSSAYSVLFLKSILDKEPVENAVRALHVVPGMITRKHVLASAAIPGAFPCVNVAKKNEPAQWCVDGGLRLNAPITSAVALGCTHVVVVAAHPTQYPNNFGVFGGEEPDVLDTGALAMQSIMADRVIDDLAHIKLGNRLAANHVTLRADQHYRHEKTYKHVDVLAIQPARGELADLAEETLKRHKRNADVVALQRLLRGLGNGPGAKELLSYIYFDSDYFAAQFTPGRAAALAAIDECNWLGGGQRW